MEVYIPEKEAWVKCDPTWDASLKKAGFEIAEWDGINHTSIAVNPTTIYSPEKTLEYKEKYNNPALISEHFDYHAEFYLAINKWMMNFRIN